MLLCIKDYSTNDDELFPFAAVQLPPDAESTCYSLDPASEVCFAPKTSA